MVVSDAQLTISHEYDVGTINFLSIVGYLHRSRSTTKQNSITMVRIIALTRSDEHEFSLWPADWQLSSDR